jgi:serine/threonine protein kinase
MEIIYCIMIRLLTICFDFGNEKTNTGVGPVCWMAPESIAQRTYSKKSDVWSFGIVGEWVCLCVCSFSPQCGSVLLWVWESCVLFWFWVLPIELNWTLRERMSNLHSHLLTFIHTIFICFCVCVDIDTLLLLLLLLVYEIVAQCEPHKDKNVIDVAVRIRFLFVEREINFIPTHTSLSFLIS